MQMRSEQECYVEKCPFRVPPLEAQLCPPVLIVKVHHPEDESKHPSIQSDLSIA